jgi:hypothetical protein
MAFCAKCGTQLQDGTAFCGTCGAPVGATPVQAAQPVAPPMQPVVVQPVVVTAPAPPPASGGSALKIVLIVLGVLALFAVLVIGGIIYMVHRTVAKVKQAASDAGVSMTDLQNAGNSETIDACKYLTTADVSSALGVTIVEAKIDDNECHYLAKGSAASFAMRHISALSGGQKIPSIPGVTTDTSSSSDETTSLLDVTVRSTGGRAQMKLQKALIGGLVNGKTNTDLTGIGDEAWVVGTNLLEVRKGDMYIMFAYTNCPCTATQIAPLAKKLVDAL